LGNNVTHIGTIDFLRVYAAYNAIWQEEGEC